MSSWNRSTGDNFLTAGTAGQLQYLTCPQWEGEGIPRSTRVCVLFQGIENNGRGTFGELETTEQGTGQMETTEQGTGTNVLALTGDRISPGRRARETGRLEDRLLSY